MELNDILKQQRIAHGMTQEKLDRPVATQTTVIFIAKNISTQ